MTDPPPNPATDMGSARPATSGISRWQKVVGAGGLAVVVWVGFESPLVDAWFSDGPVGTDHGPGGNGPPEDVDGDSGREAPPGNQDREIEPDEGEHAPVDHG